MFAFMIDVENFSSYLYQFVASDALGFLLVYDFLHLMIFLGVVLFYLEYHNENINMLYVPAIINTTTLANNQ